MLKFRNILAAVVSTCCLSANAGYFGAGTNRNATAITYGTNAVTAVYCGSNMVWGGTEAWTPASLPNCTLWLDASDSATITLSNDYVVAWSDKSGKGNNTAQAAPAYRRLYKAADAVAGGLPSVSSDDRVTRHVLTPALSAAQMFFVTAYKDGNDATFDEYATIAVVDGSTSQRVGMGDIFKDSWYGTGVLANGAAKNGESVASTVALPMPLCLLRFDFAGTVSNVWWIGSQATPGRGWQGPICEVVFVSSALSSGDRALLEAYLMAKWGITP